MSSWQEFNALLRAFSLAIAVHVVMAALVVLGTMDWQPFRKPQIIGMTIEAVMVDTSEIKKQREAARQAVEMDERRKLRDEELDRQKKRDQEVEDKRKKELEDLLKKWRAARDKLDGEIALKAAELTA